MNAIKVIEDNFCIRPDYVPNKENRTLEVDGIEFWESRRISKSLLYQWHVYQYAQTLIRTKHLRSVLDIGCGPATKLISMIEPNAPLVVGIDQPTTIEFCRRKYATGEFYSDNFEAPTLKLDHRFDLIICSDVIEHLEQPDQLLSYIQRFATPNSLILISTPDRARTWGEDCLYSPKPEHIREWTGKEFADYLCSRGFDIVEHRHFPPVKTAANKLFAIHVIHQLLKRQPYRYNQAVLCKIK